jgi:hypothetical protein
MKIPQEKSSRISLPSDSPSQTFLSSTIIWVSFVITTSFNLNNVYRFIDNINHFSIIRCEWTKGFGGGVFGGMVRPENKFEKEEKWTNLK